MPEKTFIAFSDLPFIFLSIQLRTIHSFVFVLVVLSFVFISISFIFIPQPVPIQALNYSNIWNRQHSDGIHVSRVVLEATGSTYLL